MSLFGEAWTETSIPDQTGRTVMITGATSGLGLAAARALAGKGARVLVACRNEERGRRVVSELGPNTEVALVNLASLASVRVCAASINEKKLAIDALINNAGIMATPPAKTEDGFESQIGTNHLGHFALTLLLLPALERAPNARVVNVTSLWHRIGRIDLEDLHFERRPYDRWTAYSQSKLANLLFTLELNRRFERAAKKTRAFTAHPGYAKSELANNAALEGPMAFLTNVGAAFAQSSEAGALAEIRAASDPDATPGALFGPRGPFECWGTPVRVNAAKRALDETVAAALWDRSETLTNVAFQA